MKQLFFLLCGCLMAVTFTIPTLAVDNYAFETTNPEEFYQFAPQTVYTSEYGATIVVPELDSGCGLGSEKPRNAPGDSTSGSTPTTVPQTTADVANSDSPVLYPDVPGFNAGISANSCALTPIADVRNHDGSIGTLRIPAIGLTVTAWDGEVTAAMKKGVGHIESTSAWLGNIGLVGHNRGANNHFGKLKNLKLGDEITYTSSLGARTYVVTTVQRIASDDWSYLQYTSDNRITLITCVEDQSRYRLCVQAVEKC